MPPQIAAVALNAETARTAAPGEETATSARFPGGLESPTGRPTTWNVSQLVSQDRSGLTAALDEATWWQNQPAAQKTSPAVLWRNPSKSGVEQDMLAKNTKSVATWQSWEKTALDRKFMIVISILGILSLGTIIAIVGITHRILNERQKTGETSPIVEDSNPTQLATVTLKLDGSHFSGTVLRREGNSITMTGAGGVVHTFLESDLSDIKYTDPNSLNDSPRVAGKGPASRTSDKPGAASGLTAADRVIELAKGAEFPVRSVGSLDSSTALPGAIFVGVTDADVKSPAGKVLIPEGTNVTFGLVESKKVDGRISMSFELDSADFDGRHYVISSATGKLGSGVTAAFAGPKEGSPEAKARGLNVHLDNQYYMAFRAAMPVTFRLLEK
jgi:hypothetical protein